MTGDTGPAKLVRRKLAARGVSSQPLEQCPKLQVDVTRTEQGLALELKDGSARAHRRTVSTPEIAAIWIESWTRNDISSPLLLAWRPPLPAAKPADADANNVRRSLSRTQITPPPSLTSATSPSPLMLGVFAQTVNASDESTWTGFGVDACVRLGGVCVGLSGRFSRNLAFTTDDAMVETDRSATDLAATIGAPINVGRGTLTPELSLGGRWLTSTGRVQVFDPPTPCDPNTPTDPPGDPDPANPDGTDPGDPACADPQTMTVVSKMSKSLRAGLNLRYAVPVTNSAAITVGIGATWIPGAHTKNFQDGSIIGPDGNIIDDPAVPPDPSRALPGEPLWTWSAGIGLRVELR